MGRLGGGGAKDALRRRLRRASRTDELRDRVDELAEEVAFGREGLWQALTRFQEDVVETDAQLARRLAELEAQARIAPVMEMVRRTALASEPRISVILPTRNRGALLARAIASVQAQTYGNWELIIVDDASDDETQSVLAALDDPRLRAIRTEGAGASAARNRGLELAEGDLIAYLDDDNVMHDGWLKTVSWAFEQHPQTNVIYGGFVIDAPPSTNGTPLARIPQLIFRPFDAEALAHHNLADMSAIAHRSGLREARFNEGMSAYGDWEFLARLAREHRPLAVPTIACLYYTDAPERITRLEHNAVEHARVLEALGHRPASNGS